MSCPICSTPLNVSQWKNRYTSCPARSQNAGIHILYKYPAAFGTTHLSATPNHPDGPQSHCEICRGGNSGPHSGAIRCNQI